MTTLQPVAVCSVDSPAAPTSDRGVWVFPVALWFASTFFYLGQTGKFLNDWAYLRYDTAGSSGVGGAVGFVRPLDRLIFSPLVSAFSEHDWFLHLLGAVTHASTCLLVWRLLLLLRVSRLGAAIAVLCFMVSPAGFEAVLQISALPTLLGAALVVAAWLLACRYARDEVHPAVGYPIIPAMFFVSSALNEQAACGVIAIPFLCLAARDAAQPRRSALQRALFTTGLSAAAISVSVALHAVLGLYFTGTGSDAVSARPVLVSQVVASAAAWIGEQCRAVDILPDAFRAGVRAAAEYPARSAVVSVLLIAGMYSWVRLARRAEPVSEAPRSGLLFIAAIAACAATAVPILVLGPGVTARYAYAPALGLALAIGAGFIVLARLRILAKPGFRLGTTTAAGGVLIFASITMMGFQRGYHERGIQDVRELAQLRALVPDPLPDSVFVPVSADPRPGAKARGSRYERYFDARSGAFRRSAIRWAYGRDDLFVGEASPDQVNLTHLQPETAHVRGVGEVPWSRIIPFTFDDSGHAVLVTSITSGSVRITIPQTRSLAAGTHEVAMPSDNSVDGNRLMAGIPGPAAHGPSTSLPNQHSGGGQSPAPGGNSNNSGGTGVVAASQAPACYANCDGSTSAPVLNVLDFACFLDRYAVGDPYANCDGSTTPPVLSILDFNCFVSRFSAGCP